MITPHQFMVGLLIVNAAIYMLAAWLVFDRRRRHHRNRSRDLQIARTALHDFYNTFEELLDRSDVPESVCAYLLYLSNSIDDRASARLAIDQICEDMVSGKRHTFDSYFGTAECERGVIEATANANRAALIAMILRWPETARKFNVVASELALKRNGSGPILKSKVPRRDLQHPGPLSPLPA